MAALPAQGFAAAVQLSCRHAGHNTVLNAPSSMQHHGHDRHGSGHHVATGMEQHDAADSPASHKHASCSSCAACYSVAAVLPSAALSAPAHIGAQSHALSLEPLLTGYIPGGLERPPKDIAA